MFTVCIEIFNQGLKNHTKKSLEHWFHSHMKFTHLHLLSA